MALEDILLLGGVSLLAVSFYLLERRRSRPRPIGQPWHGSGFDITRVERRLEQVRRTHTLARRHPRRQDAGAQRRVLSRTSHRLEELPFFRDKEAEPIVPESHPGPA